VTGKLCRCRDERVLNRYVLMVLKIGDLIMYRNVLNAGSLMFADWPTGRIPG
jgi:hypothetical protein